MKATLYAIFVIIATLIFSCAYQFPEVDQSSTMVVRKISEAEKLVLKRQFCRAEEEFRRLLKEFPRGSPEHEIVLYNLVLLNLDSNNPRAKSSEAKKYMEEFLRIYPQSHFRTAITVVEGLGKDNHDLRACRMELIRLKKAIKIRDKSIKKLQSEIEAYKKIDWEREEKKRQIQK